ncbi:hypothetical protein AUCHE_21_00150 [Austwickia chelonae NBRC 105200]|uniref:VapC50 C-terminal domain-containing protein n=1 Tax=Austwickia chelonae NBRC 105200 TaxID=1184607 RepID=K6VV27_9MICO|nr:hypothetical protein AUCHE_21_00150 [Austwickia chelonae NBRC 105200]
MYWSRLCTASDGHTPNEIAAAWKISVKKLEGSFGHYKVTDFPQASGFLGKDPNDHHVHSAAVHCKADIVLTNDREGLLSSGGSEDSLPYEIWKPDEFFCYVDDCAPSIVCTVTRKQRDYWGKRIPEGTDLPETLTRAGLPLFAERIRKHLLQIALQG